MKSANPLKKIEISKPKDYNLKPEEFFEFYLKEFEENFSKIVKPEKPLKKIPKQKKHEFPKKQPEDVKYKSDIERRLEIFENHSE